MNRPGPLTLLVALAGIMVGAIEQIPHPLARGLVAFGALILVWLVAWHTPVPSGYYPSSPLNGSTESDGTMAGELRALRTDVQTLTLSVQRTIDLQMEDHADHVKLLDRVERLEGKPPEPS